MFRNYLVAALRNLARNKLYAGINIVGLAVGFAAAILIGLFVRDELSYDRHIPDADNIYLIYTVFPEVGRKPLVLDTTAGDLAAALKVDFPSGPVIAQAMLGTKGLRHGGVEVAEVIYWADANFFEAVPLPVYQGNLTTALSQSNSIVLTRKIARRYFGRDDPIGQSIDVLGDNHPPQPMVVTAVLQDFPSTTNLRSEIFVSGAASVSDLKAADASQPGFGCQVHIFMRAAPGFDMAGLRQAMPAFLERHRNMHDGQNDGVSLELRALRTIHVMPVEGNALKSSTDLATVYSFLAIGILIILVASINFINLMTARANQRAVEVGVRKASGAARGHLVAQFIGESLLWSALGMLLALALVELSLPAFNALVDRQIEFHYWRDPREWIAVGALTLTVGVLAGVYPALVLSSFHPATTIRIGAMQSPSYGGIRYALVVTQFAVLIALIISAGVIYRQTRYVMEEALSFDRDEVLIVTAPRATDAYVNALRDVVGVGNVALSNGLALNFGQIQQPVLLPDASSPLIYHASVGFGFLEFYGLTPLAGRFFSKERGTDAVASNPEATWHPAFVINESARRALGFKSAQEAIGKRVTLIGPSHAGASEIIGVVRDFTFQSLRQPVNPMLYYVDEGQNRTLSVRLRGNNPAALLQKIDESGKTLLGGRRPPRRLLMKQYLQDVYAGENRQVTISTVFACVAVFISCLGLLGLSTFTAERKTKEIGIRKAMGASTGNILRLLVWQFTKPVLWASLVAWLAAAFFMKRWLNGFAYHIELAPWLFIAATVCALVIAVLTVSIHSWTAARVKPVAALRYE